MRNKRLKKIQKSLSKDIKVLNENIARDDLWLGRFECRQIEAQFYDNYLICATIRFVDKATGYFRDCPVDYIDNFPLNSSQLWEKANYFITEYSGVWEGYTGLKPRDEGFIKDYTNILVDEALWQQRPFNWYLTYQYWENYNERYK